MRRTRALWVLSTSLAVGMAVLPAAHAAPATSPPPSATAAVAAPAPQQTKTVYLPERWQRTGEIPWAWERSAQSANFIVLWGERAGTDPRSAPPAMRFDPADVLAQHELRYRQYIDDMRFTPESGPITQHKIVVIVTQTWNNPDINAFANAGNLDDRTGVVNLAPGALGRDSAVITHEMAHIMQVYTFMQRPGRGFTAPWAGTFWEASAEFMTMQLQPTATAGDLSRWLRSENLYYSSSRHHYGAVLLPQYIKDRDGIGMFNRMWNEATSDEHPLETYRRLTGISQAELNRRLGEYATRTVTYDFGNRDTFLPFVRTVYGAGFLNDAYNGGQVEPVNAAAGHFRMNTRAAPSDYGFNTVKLVPQGDRVSIRLRGHTSTGAQGWTFGLVAVDGNGNPRYSPVVSGADRRIDFDLRAGEREVYLAVMGTPNAVPRYAFDDGYTEARRYPYEFRLAGATPSGFEPGYRKPAPTHGGHLPAVRPRARLRRRTGRARRQPRPPDVPHRRPRAVGRGGGWTGRRSTRRRRR